VKATAALALLLSAAAAVPVSAATRYFLVDSIASEARHAPLRAQASELARIHADIERVSGVEATLVFSTDPDINAFATELEGRRIVIVQRGLLADFEQDRDAVAAVLAHELAHHKADHIRAGHRKQQNVRVLGVLLGAAVGAHVGRESGQLAGAAAGAAVGTGANLLALKFNRNQELQADRLAVEWMIAAGYNPQGMLRVQQRLGAMAGKRQAAILSTHPNSAKRYQAAERHIAALRPDGELLTRAPEPLVGELALASADEQIQTMVAAAMAPAVQEAAPASPQSEAPAAAMAPAGGVRTGNNVRIGGNVRSNGRPVGSEAQPEVERGD
jgi:predicted Zn-dependent protease